MKRHAEIVIVENDIPLAARLSVTLSKLGYKITGIFSRARDALHYLEKERPDLVLLDDSLKGQLNGMESEENACLDDSTSIIYFNKEQSSEGIEKLLPFERSIKKGRLKKEIKASFKRLQDKYRQKKYFKSEHTFLSDRIFVRHKDKMVKIFLDEIQFIEADRNYCRVFTKERQYLLVTTLKEVFSKLIDTRFLRIHRSYIANLSHIDEIGGNHVMICGRSLPLSRKMRTELFKHFQVI